MDYFDELLYVQGLQQIFLEFPRSIENTGSAYDIFRTILRKKIGGGVMLKDLIMGAAKASYEQLWKHKMQQIKDINEDAYHWLYNLERTTWCKYDFSHYPKCGNWVATWEWEFLILFI